MKVDRKAYERDGYLIIEPGFDTQWLDDVRRATDEYMEIHGIRDRVDGLVHSINSVKQLSLFPPVLEALEELYGEPMHGFQTLNFKIGTQQPVHSDTVHFNTSPAGGMCGVWVALEDVDEDQGPLVYYPGSHKMPEYTMKDIETISDDDFDRSSHESLYKRIGLYEQFIADRIEEFELEPHYLTCPKGTALIWASNLWHGGSPIKREGSTRYSQVTHYFAADREYHVPLHTTHDMVRWKSPNWINW
tara:strand:- start:311 stop:1048 length:738 start_codon:yes stop_codon:yes gene_type:complete